MSGEGKEDDFGNHSRVDKVKHQEMEIMQKVREKFFRFCPFWQRDMSTEAQGAGVANNGCVPCAVVASNACDPTGVSTCLLVDSLARFSARARSLAESGGILEVTTEKEDALKAWAFMCGLSFDPDSVCWWYEAWHLCIELLRQFQFTRPHVTHMSMVEYLLKSTPDDHMG